MKLNKNTVLLGLLLMSALVVSRFLPWAANFSPVYALLLLGSALIRPRWFCMAICGAGLLLTDIAIGFYGGVSFVYLGYAAILGMGFLAGAMNQREVHWWRLAMVSVTSNVAFFFISNFGVWMDGLIYPRTGQGLYECYVMALPFFERSALSTLIFAFAFFKAAHSIQSLRVLARQSDSR